ncbi:cutinase [Nakamurella sp. UYEF19]|uniref:cutinase family protein n=1 Tax=Nakamurella sp. UYEF19 TaxID=1756392 RepID=UPI00339408D6
MTRHHTARPNRIRKSFVTAAATTVIAAGLVAVVPATTASAATCSAVDVSFARGTGEAAGLGTVGRPFTSSLISSMPGRSVSTYAVDYAANTSQSSAGPGSIDLVNHVTSVAAACPSTVFVLGGYSQGATVIDNAIGLRTSSSGSGAVLPAAVAPRVKAVVVFGNPLGLQRQTIETASAPYGSRAKSFCNNGDPVCGGGYNFAAHLQYASNGSTTTGAQFAAAKIAG